ncbi:selenoprotein K-like [Amphibalanus amphitrite]|uniref:selenoprotein K-like n=1 Tax=Amphibalanus amphitrite TaxID=1232801 RepID=UPI001C90E27E|nr:selenoprotein K-like [Amphibalanus amphitrite]
MQHNVNIRKSFIFVIIGCVGVIGYILKMPYISADGTVGGSPNYFSVQGLLGLFWAVVNFFQLFFRTLISPDDNKRGRSYTSDYRAPGQGGGGGGGGGGWGGGGPGGPPRGMPRRRMGGFSTGQGAAGAPPMAGGG